MLSRSSSHYQPLTTALTSQELVVLAPTTASTTSPIATDVVTTSVSATPASSVSKRSSSGRGRRRRSHSSWTNFHFVMCIGLSSFALFWIVLLARMYTPRQLRFWISNTLTQHNSSQESIY